MTSLLGMQGSRAPHPPSYFLGQQGACPEMSCRLWGTLSSLSVGDTRTASWVSQLSVLRHTYRCEGHTGGSALQATQANELIP